MYLPTFNNTRSVLTVFVHVPLNPNLDTSVKHVIVGMNFTKKLRLTGSNHRPSTEYIIVIQSRGHWVVSRKRFLSLWLLVRVGNWVCMSTSRLPHAFTILFFLATNLLGPWDNLTISCAMWRTRKQIFSHYVTHTWFSPLMSTSAFLKLQWHYLVAAVMVFLM